MIAASLITGFVFWFDDKKQVFILSDWILNYFKYAIFSFISLLIYSLVQTHLSKLYGSSLNYSIWGVKRYWFERRAHFPKRIPGFFTIKKFPLGVFVPLLVSFLSSGGLYFAAVLSSAVTVNPIYRLGRSYTHLGDFEVAKIAVSGPMSIILLAVLIKIIGASDLEDLTFVCSIIAISYMLPFPGLDGLKIFFGSRLLYVFSIIFILITVFLLNFVSGISALFIGLIFGIIGMANYFYFYKAGDKY